MFTADDVMKAHGKVKSGADFPAYIREIRAMGVNHYECYVDDGHIAYHGAGGHLAQVPARYAPLVVAETANLAEFTKQLRIHQQGGSDFMTFIHAAAANGVDRWSVSLTEMTCTYYDKEGNVVLVEEIPQ